MNREFISRDNGTAMAKCIQRTSLEEIFASAHDLDVIRIIANFLSDVDKINWFMENEFRNTVV